VLEIRFFEKTDMFSVIKLASDTLTEKYNPSLFNYFYETYPEGFIVAELNHKVIGFLVGVIVDKGLCKILMISVSEYFRKKNVGTALISKFIIEVEKKGIRTIELEVRTDNKKAISFYKKHGFEIINKINDFYQDGKSAYNMKKEI